MDLETIKGWLDWPRGSSQYLAGVDGFLDFAFSNPISDSKIWCPCVKCVNRSKMSREDAYDHLVCNGMLRGYRQWTFHGEPIVQSASYPEHRLEDNYSMHVDTHQLLNEAFGYREDDDSMPCPLDSMDAPVHGPNVEAKNFYNLLKDADHELWQGCELTKLSFLVLLFNTKCTNKWSNKSFTDLLEILQLAIPNGENLPKSFSEAKKIIKELGLGYENIHACPNNCQLYWKDKAGDDTCSVCGASRWKKFSDQATSTGKKKKKGTPAKVLRYFPLKPRLKRLYMSKHTSPLMRWHEKDRTKDGVLRHPADSEAWRSFDSEHPEFSSDSRNVRLGLATDGFNPFGKLSSSYSCWPVVLIPYNLPPWLCMKATSFVLSLLIPGPSGPGNHIDVYLQPLIEELIELWENGTDTYDSSCDETFRLRAALLWTINDFPAYGNLSGWNVHGGFACPCCNIGTSSRRLTHGHKYCFMGHRRFLEPNHKFRYNREAFDGTEEFALTPVTPTGTMILRQLEKITNFDNSQTWKKKSIFFTLPYWESNLLRHNIDVMHVEKNLCENVYGTLLNIEGKSKDNLNARLDLQELKIREGLHPQQIGPNKLYLPSSCYTMSRNEKQVFCNLLRNIKVPDGYTGNISRCVNSSQCKIFGLKSHDCHILMQQLLPVALRGLLPTNVIMPLFDLSGYFRELCSKVLQVHELDQLESRIKLTMCHLEMIFPPGFFTIMVHLVTHLAAEAKIAGPVQYRWMYPIERYLRTLKSYVRNKARPEGSIAEAYLADECMAFCSRYIEGFETRFNRPSRNDDKVEAEESSNLVEESILFPRVGRPIGKPTNYILNSLEKVQAHRYILFNCPDVAPFLKEHAAEIRRKSRPRRLSLRDIERAQNETFHEWFTEHVLKLERDGDAQHLKEEIRWLARGPNQVARKFRGFNIRGYRFRPKRYDKETQNSGVAVTAKTSSYARVSDNNPSFGYITYYGKVLEIIELDYWGKFSVVLFKCEWVDVTHGKGLNKDEYGFTLVNFSHLIHTGKKLEDEPFIFATQAEQVFYVEDELNPGWSTVIKFKPRDVYDMGNDDSKDVEYEPYHVSLLEDLVDNLHDSHFWVRTDVEGTTVDVNNGHANDS